MTKSILIPLSHTDFDPTEVAVPWKLLYQEGYHIAFATPSGRPGKADFRLVTGEGFGPLKHFFMADENGLSAYKALMQNRAFNKPIAYDDVREVDFNALLLPGGHASGVKEFIESPRVSAITSEFFTKNKPVAAICHGVLVAARAKIPSTTKSILFGKKTTALPTWMENLAYSVTRGWLGTYYKTYPQPVQREVENALQSSRDFLRGPLSLMRDTPNRRDRGFTVQDGNFLSARWPGDAHQFAFQFLAMLDKF